MPSWSAAIVVSSSSNALCCQGRGSGVAWGLAGRLSATEMSTVVASAASALARRKSRRSIGVRPGRLDMAAELRVRPSGHKSRLESVHELRLRGVYLRLRGSRVEPRASVDLGKLDHATGPTRPLGSHRVAHDG